MSGTPTPPEGRWEELCREIEGLLAGFYTTRSDPEDKLRRCIACGRISQIVPLDAELEAAPIKHEPDCEVSAVLAIVDRLAPVQDEPGPDYETRVEQMAHALHEDCILEWRGIAIVDPNRQITMHTDAAHYGQAHSLVRRIWPELDALSGATPPHLGAADGERDG